MSVDYGHDEVRSRSMAMPRRLMQDCSRSTSRARAPLRRLRRRQPKVDTARVYGGPMGGLSVHTLQFVGIRLAKTPADIFLICRAPAAFRRA